MSNNLIQVTNLKKIYGSGEIAVHALAGVDVSRAYRIELGWIPHPSLRGNTRTHRKEATTERTRARQSGKDHGIYLIASEGILAPLEAFEMHLEKTHSSFIIYSNP